MNNAREILASWNHEEKCLWKFHNFFFTLSTLSTRMSISVELVLSAFVCRLDIHPPCRHHEEKNNQKEEETWSQTREHIQVKNNNISKWKWEWKFIESSSSRASKKKFSIFSGFSVFLSFAELKFSSQFRRVFNFLPLNFAAFAATRCCSVSMQLSNAKNLHTESTVAERRRQHMFTPDFIFQHIASRFWQAKSSSFLYARAVSEVD